jgi:transposase
LAPRSCRSRARSAGLLKVYGLKIGAIHCNGFAARVLKLLEMAALTELSAAIEPLLRVREGMRTERKGFDRTLASAARRSDVGRRLMTIPASDRWPPLPTLLRSATPAAFGTSKALGAHLGLTPRVYQSGEIDRSGQISKCGDRMLRHLLYEAASALMTRTRKWSRLRALGRCGRQAPGHEARADNVEQSHDEVVLPPTFDGDSL